jgi:formate-dependent nitrite reductase membrane component NrfD
VSEPRSYYGRPVIKEPVWTPEIPIYFFLGGMAGGAAAMGAMAGASGEDELARRAWAVALLGVGLSPGLLISDLGRPARFLNMLRMFKVTSPMSVGSWILSGAGTAIAPAALHAWTGRLPRIARVARPVAGLLGLPLATYTGALIANTAVPVWHEARTALPFLFGAGGAASAGAALVMITPLEHAAPARRLTVGACAAELTIVNVMEERLGELGEPYHRGQAGRYSTVAKVLTAAGATAVATLGRRSRLASISGGAAILAGAMAERWSVYRAGFQSAADPKYTVGPQRARVESGDGHGATRTVPA